MAIDVYALGDQTMPFPGVIFPYGNPLDFNWYWITLGNNALVVDGTSQLYNANKYKYPKGTPDPVGIQLVFAPASTFGMERAWSNTIQPGVIEDRSVFLTPNYLADIFGGFSDAPAPVRHRLAHPRQDDHHASRQAYAFPSPAAPGYNAITNLTHATTDQAWTATVATLNNQTIRFLAPGGTSTDVFLGNGHYFTKHATDDEFPPVIVERRAGQPPRFTATPPIFPATRMATSKASRRRAASTRATAC